MLPPKRAARWSLRVVVGQQPRLRHAGSCGGRGFFRGPQACAKGSTEKVLEPSVLEPNVLGFWRSRAYRKKLKRSETGSAKNPAAWAAATRWRAPAGRARRPGRGGGLPGGARRGASAQARFGGRRAGSAPREGLHRLAGGAGAGEGPKSRCGRVTEGPASGGGMFAGCLSTRLMS